LSGNFSSKDMLVAQAPMLAKLLSLVSFSGLADALSGKGIRFDTIEGKFEWMDKKLQIKEAYLFGSAMGITTQGEVNLHKDTLALQGTIVPAYMLNSVFGNIPLLGPLLSGGETKGGMFAANYSVKGGMDNPDISVNPLSMLTPGFLRGIFGIFDGGKSEGKEEPQAKEAPAQESPKEAAPGMEIPEPEAPPSHP
ncbi:MAG: AsmA-like C-terminal domain-containing protein, partial [Alphaproteobacteria bacterium]|nr:AsmA-like C-terminal domain-containing protein [Alphaproteobacteria bacterium]